MARPRPCEPVVWLSGMRRLPPHPRIYPQTSRRGGIGAVGRWADAGPALEAPGEPATAGGGVEWPAHPVPSGGGGEVWGLQPNQYSIFGPTVMRPAESLAPR